MSEEEFNELLDLFRENNLTKYGIDKLYGEIVDREIERNRLKEQLQQKENIIKEVRERLEYLLNNDKVEINGKIYIKQEADNIITKYILEILDKEVN